MEGSEGVDIGVGVEGGSGMGVVLLKRTEAVITSVEKLGVDVDWVEAKFWVEVVAWAEEVDSVEKGREKADEENVVGVVAEEELRRKPEIYY